MGDPAKVEHAAGGEKKRKFPQSDEQEILPFVIQWLDKRKITIPSTLHTTNSLSSLDKVTRLLALKERERRALKRHVEKCQRNGGTEVAPEPLEDSDGEYDQNEVDDVCARSSPWPSDVEFSNNYRWDSGISSKQDYSPSNIRNRKPRLSNKVYFKRISDANHPACGEFGLFCANDAKPGSWLLDYVGHVSLGENQDKESDYVSDFGLKSELALDANIYGNESRMINDFRNTGRYPNVEFNLRRDKHGELRQGVYVKSTKDARQVGFDGIKKDEEILISYGKRYWKSRVGSGGMEGFVWRYPGQPMPPGGKPSTSKSGHERQDA